MLTICWSVKGGSGTSVVAASLALILSRRDDTDVLIIDLHDDLPSIFGMANPNAPGIHDWLGATGGAGPEALDRLAVPVSDRVRMVCGGSADTTEASSPRWTALADWLGGDQRTVIVDCGTTPPAALARAATTSLLVLRQCYLAVRRATDLAHPPTGIVLLTEDGRALSPRVIEQAVGVPIVAQVPIEPAVARAVDAGLLVARLPATQSHSLRRAA